MGFGQGPGQANNIGGIFETNGFIGGQAFGLAIATIGFVSASIAGVYYINKRAKEGLIKRVSTQHDQEVSNHVIESSEEIPVSEAIDKMSIQIIFIFVVYACAWVFMTLLSSVIGDASNFQQSMVSLVWGFNFIFAMLFAIVFKLALKFITRKGWMKRKYTNEYMLNRLSGVLFDFMVVASLMSINIEALVDTGLLVTLMLMTSAGVVATYYYLKYTTKKLFPDYVHEAFATMFGNLTGTAPNGIALLREIDPNPLKRLQPMI